MFKAHEMILVGWSDRTRLLLTGAALAIGCTMAGCGGEAPFGPPGIEGGDELTVVSTDGLEPLEQDDGDEGARNAPEGLEIY